MIKAEIIADSIDFSDNRITTFVLQFPRIVLAEFNTHRMISKNSASSRAIPFDKMLKRVEENPFIPIKWMKEHKGMQGTEYFEGEAVNELYNDWLLARDNAVAAAKVLSDQGLTKQIVNRLLEPFMWHTVICTGTEWENFFALRAHPAAEIHIAKLAELMLEAYNNSEPNVLKEGEWHIPFGDKFDKDRLYSRIEADHGVYDPLIYAKEKEHKELIEIYKVRISTARCARVSYLNFEGKDDFEADIKLHTMLSESGHWSPFEHCAMCTETNSTFGNFKGWKQYRKFFEGENKTDSRVKKVKTSIGTE